MDALTQRLFDELRGVPLIDPHTHVNPHSAASTHLADLLGYHYYTELAHSAGMSKAPLAEGVPVGEQVRAVAEYLPAIENTNQYSWLLEIARDLLGFEGDAIDATNIDVVEKLADDCMSGGNWEQQVLRKSNIEQVFLTNNFDDPLEGFDTSLYVPCLRTDELVFKLHDRAVMERLRSAGRTDVNGAKSLKAALARIFEHFTAKGARACAISLPPSFSPFPESTESVDSLLNTFWSRGELTSYQVRTVHRIVFWMIAELADDYALPFDLMIGVNRDVYPGGVAGGTDLFNHLTSLYQYQRLFNAMPNVTFPVSVLDNGCNQELASYAWIFPNVVTSGHWWYANIAPTIEADLRHRLAAVPRTKQIGYYSDAYKLEFILPKFNMYRRVLAGVLACDFVQGRGWSEEKAVALGRDLLRGNVERIFKTGG